MSKTNTITYDATKTTIIGAKMNVVAKCDWVPSDYIIYFNGDQVRRIDWGIGSSGEDTAVMDVDALKGNNVTVVTFEQPIGGGTLTFTLTLIVEFLGVEPKIVNPNFWEEWPTWWPYAAAGGGLAIVGLIILLMPKMPQQLQRESSGVQPIVIYANGRKK